MTRLFTARARTGLIAAVMATVFAVGEDTKGRQISQGDILIPISRQTCQILENIGYGVLA